VYVTLQAAAQYEYINMAYTAEDGSPAVYRVSPNHGVYTVTAAINPGAPAAAPGVGTVQRAERVTVRPLGLWWCWVVPAAAVHLASKADGCGTVPLFSGPLVMANPSAGLLATP
jgi:hypothetical protein